MIEVMAPKMTWAVGLSEPYWECAQKCAELIFDRESAHKCAEWIFDRECAWKYAELIFDRIVRPTGEPGVLMRPTKLRSTK